MKQTMEEKRKRKNGNLYRNILQLVVVGSITGICAGSVVTLFNILAEKGEEFSQGVYAFVRAQPAFLPLLLAALIAGAFLIGVAVQISSVIRGCGIPQAEGATRGSLRFRWYRDATAAFAACLLNIFMGLSIGAEGPSALIGACVGDGVADLTRRNEMIRRYQVTGGACTGLAVASNAPLTGIVFAFEEAHKRFTPEVFICAFSSVIFGVLTRFAMYSALGLEIQSAFHSYIFHEMPLANYGFVVAAGIVCGGLGVAFYKFCFFLRKQFSKISLKNPAHNHSVRILIAVLLGGFVSFLAAGAMGGGHDLIEWLGTHGGAQAAKAESLFGMLTLALAVILLLKFFITAVNVGSGIPCGIFIPIIAIGACIGALLNEFWLLLGMDAAFCDLMIMICIAAFFTTIVKAPLTAIIMICELTGSFAPLLPVVIGVSIGYFIGDLSRTDSIYEELLELYEEETSVHENTIRTSFTFTLAYGSIAERREIRDVLWPAGVRVTEILRSNERILPDGDTVLLSGDVLTLEAKTREPQKVKDELEHIFS